MQKLLIYTLDNGQAKMMVKLMATVMVVILMMMINQSIKAVSGAERKTKKEQYEHSMTHRLH